MLVFSMFHSDDVDVQKLKREILIFVKIRQRKQQKGKIHKILIYVKKMNIALIHQLSYIPLNTLGHP